MICRTTPARPTNRSGFATLTSIVLLGMMAIAVEAMTAAYSADARRAQRASVNAQLRQLLLAGAADTNARSQTWPEHVIPTRWNIATPTILSTEDTTLTAELSLRPDGTADAQIEAAYHHHRMEQTLHFAKAEGTWKLKDVSLDR